MEGVELSEVQRGIVPDFVESRSVGDPPGFDELDPVRSDAAPLGPSFEIVDQAGAPIDERSEDIER